MQAVADLVDSTSTTFRERLEAADFEAFGVMTAQGYADGINEGIDNTVTAILDLGNHAINAFTGLFSFGSPSKRFKLYGKWTVQGFIDGINETMSLATDQMDYLCDSIIQIASTTPDDMPQIGTNIVDGVYEGIKGAEQNFASRVSSFFSGIVNRAKDALGISSPSKRFSEEIGLPIVQGIETGIEDNAYLAENAARDMSDSVLDRAREWIRNYQRLFSHSVEEELKMWQRLTDVYRKESEERLEIDHNIARLQNQIGRDTIDEANRWLELRRRNNDVSAREEVILWQSVTDSIIKGTEAREDAERRLHEANQRMLAEREDLTNRMMQLEKQYEEAVENRAGSIADAFRLFDGLREREEVSAQTLKSNLQDQVGEMRSWADNMTALADRGIDDGLLAALRGMGPAANAEISALISMSESQLEEYAEMWSEMHEIAKVMAVEELTQLREDTDDEIGKLAEQLEYLAGTTFVQAGVNTMKGYADGITAGLPLVQNALIGMDQNDAPELILGITDILPEVVATFSKRFTDIVDIVSSKLIQMSRKAQDILNRVREEKTAFQLYQGLQKANATGCS